MQHRDYTRVCIEADGGPVLMYDLELRAYGAKGKIEIYALSQDIAIHAHTAGHSLQTAYLKLGTKLKVETSDKTELVI